MVLVLVLVMHLVMMMVRESRKEEDPGRNEGYIYIYMYSSDESTESNCHIPRRRRFAISSKKIHDAHGQLFLTREKYHMPDPLSECEFPSSRHISPSSS